MGVVKGSICTESMNKLINKCICIALLIKTVATSVLVISEEWELLFFQHWKLISLKPGTSSSAFPLRNSQSYTGQGLGYKMWQKSGKCTHVLSLNRATVARAGDSGKAGSSIELSLSHPGAESGCGAKSKEKPPREFRQKVTSNQCLLAADNGLWPWDLVRGGRPVRSWLH